MNEYQRHAAQIRRLTWIGLAVNLFLAILKIAGGILGSSQAVVADGVHSLSDMTTDLAVLLGVGFWSAPADEEHPYGHWGMESIITTAMGISLIIVALGIGYKALVTIREVHVQQPGWIAISGVSFSIIFKEALFHWTLRVGKASKSSAVVAYAWHLRSDAFSSIPVLIAVAVAAVKPDWAFIDHIGALIVSLIILKVSLDIFRPAFSALMDRSAPKEDREKIRSIALDINGVELVHAIRSRKSGPGFNVDLHVKVHGDMSVRQGHEISEMVKHKLIENGPDILDVVVHLEPYERDL